MYPESESPSPEEIAKACEEIQEKWTEAERRRRAPAEGDVKTAVYKVADLQSC